MAQTKIKAGLFEGIIGNGTDGYYLMSNGDGTMTWSSIIVNPNITNVAYPGSATAANPAGNETITLTGTGFQSGVTVTVGGTTATTVSYISETQITFTTPPKSPGDYDIAITNTDTGSTTYINGISYNGIPSWTTPTGSLGTFASDKTISTITLQAAEPDAGTITFNITSGALPTGLSLTGADIDGTTSIENADTTYNFTVTATDDESQSTGRSFSITVEKYIVQPLENFTINTYTGNGSTQSIEGKIGTAASFNGSSSYVNLPVLGLGGNATRSISAWVNPATTPSNLGAVYHSGGTNAKESFIIYYQSDNKIRVEYDNRSIVTTTTILNNTWTHIVATYNGGSIESSANTNIYINGVLQTVTNSGSATGVANTLNTAYAIGYRRQAGTLYFNGKIDQVRIFDKALSSSEVTTLYGENNTSTTKSTTDIFDDGSGVALYEFEEGAKDTGGVNGYINGGATFNGSNSYIHYPDSLINKTSSSISFWLYSKGANAASNDQYVFLYNNSSTGAEFPIILRNNGTSLDFTFGTTPRKTLNLNEWYNVIINFKSNNTQDIYIDGVLLGSTSHTSSMSGTKIWTMGRYNRSGLEGSYLNADIDEFRIYSTNLSTNDIGYIANNDTANIPTANLTSYYKFDGNAVDEQLNNTATPTNVIFNYNGTPTNVGFVGTSFQPDLVWIKDRDVNYSHQLYDSVRGATKKILSNSTAAESTDSTGLTAFDSNGFTISTNVGINTNNNDYVAWCWKAGGTVSANNNTDGTITSTVSANQNTGFSIVKWTGTGINATVGHGLTNPPEIRIIKGLSSGTTETQNWFVWVAGIGTNDEMILNGSGMPAYAASVMNQNQTPTSTTLPIGGDARVNQSGKGYIAYCFHSVDSYQKVGTYSGGSTNTISTGFKPRFIIVKRTNRNGDDWHLFDSTREGDDSTDKMLKPNTSDSEGNGGADRTVNFTSDGFNWTNANSNAVNASGGEYIYLAIA